MAGRSSGGTRHSGRGRDGGTECGGVGVVSLVVGISREAEGLMAGFQGQQDAEKSHHGDRQS